MEEAHLKYCVLDVYQRYAEVFSSQVISHNLQETLHDITPLLHEAFSAEFAGIYGFVIGSAKLGMHSANYIFSIYSNDAKNQRTTG